jgi:ADP-heptose:LPS heptosyltransferase
MKRSKYRQRWTALRDGSASDEQLVHLSRQVALAFLDHYYQDGQYEQDYISLLCEMAMAFAGSERNRIASGALFGIVVENLCDDYEQIQLPMYNSIMAQIVSYCRRQPAGRYMDKILNSFGLYTAKDLLNRANRVHAQSYHTRREHRPKRIYILSRVTIGADVAIVSVMVQQLVLRFPDAEIVIFGGPKLTEIFGGNQQIRICEATYPRQGTLMERFDCWRSILEQLKEENKKSGKDDVILIDPDSRLSQLGVLPLVSEDRYLYFNSHATEPGMDEACMAEITNYWANSVLGGSHFCTPRLWLEKSLRSQGNKTVDLLRRASAAWIVAVNLGVGGNQRKRVGREFEIRLLLRLLREPNTVVLLDKGFGLEEHTEFEAIAAALQSKGVDMAQMRVGDAVPGDFSHGVLGVESTIGQMAALIGASDEYIGYDSACQHIAAAQGIPTTTVFAGTNNPAFIRRWSAYGDTHCHVIHAGLQPDGRRTDMDDIVERIMQERIHRSTKSSAQPHRPRPVVEIPPSRPPKRRSVESPKQNR